MRQYSRVQLEGLADLKKTLEGLGQEVATKIGQRANRDAAKELQRRLIVAAPRSNRATRKYWRRKNGTAGSDLYGHLYENIRVRKARSRKANHIVYNVSTGRAFWGTFLEFGTRHMSARPWMRPVFDAFAQDGIEIQINGLRAGIEREARRRARLARKHGRVLPNGRNA